MGIWIGCRMASIKRPRPALGSSTLAPLHYAGALGFQSEQGRKLGGDWHGRLEELIGADCNGRGAVLVTARESVEARSHFLHGEASGIVFHAELVQAVECVHLAGSFGDEIQADCVDGCVKG